MSRFPERLVTRRLVLRAPTALDAEGVLDAVTASYPELHRWMDWAKAPYGIDEARWFCNDARAKFEEGRDFPTLLTLPGDGRIIGGAGLMGWNADVPSFEIGYWVHTAFAGQGYVTEAARALTLFAFDTLASRRVVICMDTDNWRSRAVAERLGFEWEATLKRERLNNAGRVSDTRVYAMFDRGQLATG